MMQRFRSLHNKKLGVCFYGKYAFYDAVMEVSDINFVRNDSYYISRQKRRLAGELLDSEDQPKKGVVIETANTSNRKGPSFNEVFGGSSKTATKSSRRDLSYRNKHKMIGGVSVPARPIEPDNCCMSGCINCVWELFNEDLEEWRSKRNTAAKNLMKQKNTDPDTIEKWPKDWDLPPKILDPKFISSKEHRDAFDKGITGEENAKGMPLGLQAFAEFEKKLKSSKLKKI